MSRLGKLAIQIPAGVQVTIANTNLTVKGPKGEVVEYLPRAVTVVQDGQTITVSVTHPDSPKERALWGLVRQLIANAVSGAAQGFNRRLEMSGIGFKAQLEGKDLVLNLGFSHPIRFIPPAGVTLTVDKNSIIVTGASKQLVGQVAADIRAFKPPEPYKGKGIRYAEEVIRRKAGKAVKAAGAK